MVGIIGVIAFITVLALSLLVTRVATVALAITGLSHQVAGFQARSAFTGTGFTTSEAEKVVNEQNQYMNQQDIQESEHKRKQQYKKQKTPFLIDSSEYHFF